MVHSKVLQTAQKLNVKYQRGSIHENYNVLVICERLYLSLFLDLLSCIFVIPFNQCDVVCM